MSLACVDLILSQIKGVESAAVSCEEKSNQLTFMVYFLVRWHTGTLISRW